MFLYDTNLCFFSRVSLLESVSAITANIPEFTMANPGSFAWALEMYGWGGIGLSYLMMAGIFQKRSAQRFLFLLNGISIIASALMTSFNMNWLFSPAGFAALITWNLLVLIIDIRLIRYFRQQKSSFQTFH